MFGFHGGQSEIEITEGQFESYVHSENTDANTKLVTLSCTFVDVLFPAPHLANLNLAWLALYFRINIM